MMKNGVPLSEFCEGAKGVNVSWSNVQTFASPYDDYKNKNAVFGDNVETISEFQTNGQPLRTASKGTRPNVKMRLEKTEAAQYYLIKFSDNSVRLSTQDVEYTSSPQGDIIGTPEENLRFLIVELQGAGGGACGGNALLAGDAGASGAYVLGLINLEHEAGANWKKNSVPLQVGKGGAGVQGRNKAGNGTDTGFYVSQSLALCASGGSGGDANSPGSSRSIAIAGVESFFTVFDTTEGYGASGGNNTTSIPEFTSSRLAPEGEPNTISYPSYATPGAGFGGAGGCTHFGAGGRSYNSVNQNGEDGQGAGAGGGGGTARIGGTTHGGNGRDGLIRFYY